MDLQAQKISLAQQILSIQKESILQRYKNLLKQAEMEEMTDLSLESIKEGKVKTLEEFSQEAKEWIKNKKNTK